MMAQQVLCSVLELAINQALALNMRGVEPLQSLEQKTLTVKLTELGFPLSFSVNAEKVLVTGMTEHSDCVLDTSIKTLVELQKEQQITELIKQEKLDLRGDIKIAQQFANLVDSLEIDWQSELAKHIGDIPMYKLKRLQQFVGNKLSFAAQQVQADASEWLVHEKQFLVTGSQVAQFNQQVVQTSQATQILSNRIAMLVAHQLED